MPGRLFKCIVATGHRGAGRSGERVVFLRAADCLEAMRKAQRLPGVKKGRRWLAGAAVISLVLVA